MTRTGCFVDVAVVGSANMDVSLRLPRIPQAGETVLAWSKTIAAGGKGANQAAAAASAGSTVAFIGCLGADADADAALADLQARGVDVSAVRRLAGRATGTAVILVDDFGENVIVVEPGANRHLDPEQVSDRLQELNPSVILAQLEINLDAVLAAARDKGTAVFILNPAPVEADSASLAVLLERTDILIPNRSEFGWLSGRDEPRSRDELDACRASLDFSGAVVVTLGEQGAVVYPAGSRRDPIAVSPVRVQGCDASGAGDVFCGVFAHAVAHGADLVAAATIANQAAAESTQHPGARPPITVDVLRS